MIVERERPDWAERVIDLVGLGTFFWRIDDGEVVADSAACEILGYTEGYTFSRRFSKFLEHVHPEDRANFRARLLVLRVDRTKKFSVDQRMRTRSGAWKAVNVVCSVYTFNERGVPSTVLGVISDISSRQLVVDELVHSQLLFSALFHSVPGAIYQRTYDDGVWTMLYLSHHIKDITGYRTSAFTDQKRSWNSIIVEDDYHRMVEEIDAALEVGDDFEVQYRITTHEGKERWILDRGQATRSPTTRKIAHLSGVMTDITTQKAQFMELELVRTVVENTNDGVIITEAEPFDPPGPRIVYVNPSQCRNSGYSREEVLGKTPRMFTGPNSSKETSREIREAMERWEPVQTEVLNYRKDGSEYWADLSIVPVANKAGWYTHWISVQRDITARKAHESLLHSQAEALRTAKDAAEEATQVKSDFLATMSHEIRTPMSGVIGMTSMLRETELDSEQQDYVETIRFSSEALLELINDILDFSKGEAGRIELEEHRFDLIQAVEESLELVAPKARSKGLRLAYSVAHGVPQWVCGDSARFRQIVVNLVGNAVKFTEFGEVSLTVTLAERRGVHKNLIHFVVEDTGIGIPENRMSRLFQPFSQVDSSTTRRYGGTGLGLAICRDLTELMGGSIGVESQEGVGSSFWFNAVFETLESSFSAVELKAQQALANKRVRVDTSWKSARNFFRELVTRMGAVWVSDEDKVPDIYVFEGSPDESVDATHAWPLVFHENRVEPNPSGFAIRWPLRQHVALGRFLSLLGVEIDASALDEDDTDGGLEHFALRIVFADDNPVNQKVVNAMLRRMGLKADSASNGQQVVELLMHSKYDVVLMDMQMPVMDGVTAAQKIRSKGSSIHQPVIIALTAGRAEEEREKCLQAGMNAFLSKPLRFQTLRTALETAARHFASSNLPPPSTPVEPSS